MLKLSRLKNVELKKYEQIYPQANEFDKKQFLNKKIGEIYNDSDMPYAMRSVAKTIGIYSMSKQFSIDPDKYSNKINILLLIAQSEENKIINEKMKAQNG